MEIAEKFREERGEASLHLAVILLVGMLLFAAAMQVHHVYAVLDMAAEKTNEAVLAVAASNVPEVYRGVRESDGTARRYNAGAWGHTVSTDAVLEALGASLGAVPHGDGLLIEGSFQINRLRTTYINMDGGNLNFTTTMEVVIPLTLGGGGLPAIHSSLEVKTTYEPKF